MIKRTILLAVLLAGVAIGCSGCLAVAALGVGAGTVAYVRGDLEAVEDASLDSVYKATEKAMDKLGIAVIEKTKDAMTAVITARDAEDKKITIKLVSAEKNATKISIRVGVFGSETKSTRIYEEIKKYL